MDLLRATRRQSTKLCEKKICSKKNKKNTKWKTVFQKFIEPMKPQSLRESSLQIIANQNSRKNWNMLRQPNIHLPTDSVERHLNTLKESMIKIIDNGLSTGDS